MYNALIVFSTIGACITVFMVLHLWFISKGANLKKIALGLYLIGLTLRNLKSVLFFLFLPDLSNIFLALGFLGFSLMPVFLFYYYNLTADDVKREFSRSELLHFGFPIIGFLLVAFYPVYAETLYFISLMTMGVYGYLIYKTHIADKKKQKRNADLWNLILFRINVILFLAFLLPYLIRYPYSYAIGTAIVSLTVFGMFFFYLKIAPKLKVVNRRFQISKSQKEKVINSLEHDSVYRDSSLTLHLFSNNLGIPQYIIKEVVKEHYDKSFHGVINYLRIREIKEALKDESSLNLKIEELAFDAGFNTISVFYSVFKKETSMSPREYQRIHAYGA